MPATEFYTPPQIAEFLGVKSDRVRCWIRSGELQAINVADAKGRPRWRISDDAFCQFLTGRSNKQRQSPEIARRSPPHGAVKSYV